MPRRTGDTSNICASGSQLIKEEIEQHTGSLGTCGGQEAVKQCKQDDDWVVWPNILQGILSDFALQAGRLSRGVDGITARAAVDECQKLEDGLKDGKA